MVRGCYFDTLFMITRNGIYNNINDSTYTVCIDNIVYYFSSQLYKRKFLERYKKERDILNLKLSKKYKMTIEANILSDLFLYSHIEKRGFKVETNEEVHQCLQNINLQLERKI